MKGTTAKLVKRLSLENNLRPFLLLFLVGILLLFGSKLLFHLTLTDNLGNLWSEVFGMLLDIIFLGLFLTFLNNKNDKKEKIERYFEEIDDFREWESAEAKCRILGNAKRLIKLGRHSLDLSNCYLNNSTFSSLNLTGTTFRYCSVENSMFSETTISEANFNVARLSGSHFVGCQIDRCNFQAATLARVSFLCCNFEGSSFKSTDCEDCDFGDADVSRVDFSRTKLKGARLSYTVGLVAEQLINVKSLYHATLPAEIEETLKDQFPKIYDLLINDVEQNNFIEQL